MADYEHAWDIGGGSDEEGFAADYDTGGRNKFTKMGMRGRSGLSEARWAKLAGILEGGGDSGDYEGRIDAWDGDDSDMGPPSKDDWEVDAAPSYDDTEGSDFDELITPADDNDDTMNPAWMNPSPYADTDDDTWGDDPDWGRSSATGRARDKYRGTGNSDPEDAYTHSGPRGLDETEDSNYNADLQQTHGRFTSPENVKGTPQHKQKHSPPAPAPTHGGGGWDYSEYDNLHYGPGINEARWAKLSGVLKD